MADQLATIREFITTKIGGFEVADDEDLFESGYVNSLFAVQIVMFVENTLGLPVVEDDLDIKNFASIVKIDSFASAKRATSQVNG